MLGKKFYASDRQLLDDLYQEILWSKGGTKPMTDAEIVELVAERVSSHLGRPDPNFLRGENKPKAA